MFYSLKINNYIQQKDYLQNIIKSIQPFPVNLNESLKSNLIIIAIALLIIITIPILSSAQDLSNFTKNKNNSINLAVEKAKNIEVESHVFDRLIINLNYKYSLFNKQMFFNLQNYFRQEVVLYSLNDEFNFDVVWKDYSTAYYSTSKRETSYNDAYQFNFTNYDFNLYIVHRESFFENFIMNVERNQFFYDMDTKSNQIYTNEFSILDFQSTHAEKYLSGTKIWGGIGFGMVGVLMLMPKSVTKWQDGYIDDAMSNLNRAFSEPPVMDEDHWEINYIGHPYAGSLFYNTIRAQGGTVFHSFLFSTFASTSWEYLYEGAAEQPSIQDLIVTPIAGAVLGELIHQATIGMKRNGFSVFEAAFVTVFNPMYVILNGYR